MFVVSYRSSQSSSLPAMNKRISVVLAFGLGVYFLLHGQACVDANPVQTGKANSANGAKSPRLVLISLDGFRWDYMKRATTKNLHYIAANGVRATDGVTASFITKTFPNHMSMVTGLWEESHGIVANNMYDPVLKQNFSRANISALKDSAWFDVGAEPIWVTNQNQGGRSGVVIWIGGDVRIKSTTPTKYVSYEPKIKNSEKMDLVVNWFKTSVEPFNLALVYFDQPDSCAHRRGPESGHVTEMIGVMDEVIGYLLDQLEMEGLLDDTNIIVTGDHGFVSTPSKNGINLDDIIDPAHYRLSEPSPVAAVWPNKGYFQKIYEDLTKAAIKNQKMKVYKKEDLPKKFHYSNNRRIAPIQVLANRGFYFITQKFPSYRHKGDHGYRNDMKEMRSFFVAMGPAFRKGAAVNTFDNVDIYPLMCHILDLRPAPNNGTMEVVEELLRDFSSDDDLEEILMATGSSSGSLALVIFVTGIIYWCKKKCQKNDTAVDPPAASEMLLEGPHDTASPQDAPAVSHVPHDTASPQGAPTVSHVPHDTASPQDAPAVSHVPHDTASPQDALAVSHVPHDKASPQDAPAVSQAPHDTDSPQDAPADSHAPHDTASPQAAPAVSHAPHDTASPQDGDTEF